MARHRPEAQVTGSFGRAVQACRHELGVTRERVRQIQIEALRRLRYILEREGFSLEHVLE